MKFKKSLISVLALGSIFVSTQTSFASELKSNHGKNVINGSTDLKAPNTEVSEVLTFDELVKRISIDNGISEFEAANQVIKSRNSDKLRSSSTSTLASSETIVSPYAATYRTISAPFTVKTEYKPQLRFYCETSEGGGYWGIVKILNVGMNRSYNGLTKQFGGTVYTNLETAARIYWVVNGDFFENGTTTVSGGVNIGVGGTDVVNFNVSYSSNHYAYTYKEGTTQTQ